jgi:hypothetical protein
MLPVFLAWSGNALQLLILYRAAQARMLRMYPFFYAYIALSLLSFFVLSIVLRDSGVHSKMYASWFWPIQLVTLLLGCGIVLEVLNRVLSPYPGAERIARMGGLIAFGGAFCVAFASPLLSSQWSAAGTMVELERNLRTVQAVLLLGIVIVVSYYRIPVGRNMKGMIVGYGLYVGTSLISLAIWAYEGPWLQAVWAYVPAITFMMSLLIWTSTLWSYHPASVPESSIGLETDYEMLTARTRQALSNARAQLARTVRP